KGVMDLRRTCDPVMPSPQTPAGILKVQSQGMFSTVCVARGMVAEKGNAMRIGSIGDIHPVDDHVVLDAIPTVEKGILKLAFRYIERCVLVDLLLVKVQRKQSEQLILVVVKRFVAIHRL